MRRYAKNAIRNCRVPQGLGVPDDVIVAQQLVICLQDVVLCYCSLRFRTLVSDSQGWRGREGGVFGTRLVFQVLDGQVPASLFLFISQDNQLSWCHCPS